MSVMDAAQIVALAREGLAEGLTTSAELVRGRSVARTPLEYGDLRSSQTVVPATEAELESAVVSDLDYAVPVHEDLNAYHDDGEAKFLERAVTESRDDIGDIIATSVRRRLA
jgi:hypothetical protein